MPLGLGRRRTCRVAAVADDVGRFRFALAISATVFCPAALGTGMPEPEEEYEALMKLKRLNPALYSTTDQLARVLGIAAVRLEDRIAGVQTVKMIRRATKGSSIAVKQSPTKEERKEGVLPIKHAAFLHKAEEAPMVQRLPERKRAKALSALADAIAELPRPEAQRVVERFVTAPQKPMEEIKKEAETLRRDQARACARSPHRRWPEEGGRGEEHDDGSDSISRNTLLAPAEQVQLDCLPHLEEIRALRQPRAPRWGSRANRPRSRSMVDRVGLPTEDRGMLPSTVHHRAALESLLGVTLPRYDRTRGRREWKGAAQHDLRRQWRR